MQPMRGLDIWVTNLLSAELQLTACRTWRGTRVTPGPGDEGHLFIVLPEPLPGLPGCHCPSSSFGCLSGPVGGPPPATHLWRFIGLLGFPSLYGGKPGPVPPWAAMYVHEGGSEVPLGVSETASEGWGVPQTHPNPTAQISFEKRVTVKGSLTAITGIGLGSRRSGSCRLLLGKYWDLDKLLFSGFRLLSHR